MNSAEAKAIANMFLDGLEREFPVTKKVLAAIPENQLDFKLGDKGRTARELAWHLAASEVWFAEGAANADYNRAEPAMPDKATVADIVAYYDRELPALLAKVRSLPGEQLAKEDVAQRLFSKAGIERMRRAFDFGGDWFGGFGGLGHGGLIR